jgi:hypothetical protein
MTCPGWSVSNMCARCGKPYYLIIGLRSTTLGDICKCSVVTCPNCGFYNIPDGTEICPNCYCLLSSNEEAGP